jgi:hypothetical protein
MKQKQRSSGTIPETIHAGNQQPPPDDRGRLPKRRQHGALELRLTGPAVWVLVSAIAAAAVLRAAAQAIAQALTGGG